MEDVQWAYNIMDEKNINNTNEQEDKLNLDPTSADDRRKIVKGYKKSLRNRVTAPLLNSTKGINPIDVIKQEEQKEKMEEQIEQYGEEEDSSFDMYSIFNYKLRNIEKKIDLCLSLARIAMLLSIAAIFASMFILITKL